MPYGQHRMKKRHARTRITHDFPNPLPHLRFITVNRTSVAYRLIRTKRTFFDTLLRIFQESGAFRTGDLRRFMMPSTIDANHNPNCFHLIFHAGVIP